MLGYKIELMKKIFLLFAVLFIATTVNAQYVNVGPKIGYHTSKLSFKGSDMKQSFSSDMALGMFARFSFAKFIVQPEVLYSFNARTCFTVPVYLGYKLFDNKIVKMRAVAGPVLFYNTIKSVPENRATLGGSLGLGADIWRFTVDINYSLGSTYSFVTTSMANQNIFTVTLGFKLRY